MRPRCVEPRRVLKDTGSFYYHCERREAEEHKVQVGDMKRAKDTGHLEFMNAWYPVQVKQKDKVGRPDVDAFEAMMARSDRTKGFEDRRVLPQEREDQLFA